MSVSAQQLLLMLRHAMRPTSVLHGELQIFVVSCCFTLALKVFFHKIKMRVYVLI